jgi:hypothetical protein
LNHALTALMTRSRSASGYILSTCLLSSIASWELKKNQNFPFSIFFFPFLFFLACLLSSWFFIGDDRDFLKKEIKTYLISSMSPFFSVFTSIVYG